MHRSSFILTEVSFPEDEVEVVKEGPGEGGGLKDEYDRTFLMGEDYMRINKNWSMERRVGEPLFQTLP